MAGEQRQQDKKYKSPQSKLVKFFEKSRDAWKKKCRAAKRTSKRLKDRIRFLEHSKGHWKSRAQELEREFEGIRAEKQSLENTVDSLQKNNTA